MKINAMGINISQNNNINKTSATSALFKNIKVDEENKEGKSLKFNNKNNQNELLNNFEKIKQELLHQKEALREKQMSPEEKNVIRQFILVGFIQIKAS